MQAGSARVPCLAWPALLTPQPHAHQTQAHGQARHQLTSSVRMSSSEDRGWKTSTRLASAARLSAPGNVSGKRSRAIWVSLRGGRLWPIKGRSAAPPLHVARPCCHCAPPPRMPASPALSTPPPAPRHPWPHRCPLNFFSVSM